MRKITGYHLEEVEHGECKGCAFLKNGRCTIESVKNIMFEQKNACICTKKNLIWVKDKEK